MDKFFEKIRVPFEVIEFETKNSIKTIEVSIKEGTIEEIRESIPGITDFILYGGNIDNEVNNRIVFKVFEKHKNELEPHFLNYLRGEYNNEANKEINLEFEYVNDFVDTEFKILPKE